MLANGGLLAETKCVPPFVHIARAGGKDLTVASVDDGRRAAESIHQFLSA